jgi:hypothetical protein
VSTEKFVEQNQLVFARLFPLAIFSGAPQSLSQLFFFLLAMIKRQKFQVGLTGISLFVEHLQLERTNEEQIENSVTFVRIRRQFP